MRVEFFGISGVGKTTIAKKYVSEQVKKGYVVVWPWNKLYTKSNWFFRNIKKSRWVLRRLILHFFWCKQLFCVLKKLDISLRDTAKLFYNGIYLKESFNSNKYDYIYVYDEGVVQYLYAIYLRAEELPRYELVDKIIKLFGCPEKIIVVRSDANVIKKRLENRNRKTRILETNDLLGDIIKLQDIEKKILDILVMYFVDYEQIDIYCNN